MEFQKIGFLITLGILVFMTSPVRAQKYPAMVSDSTQAIPAAYDPFGPENSPDHNGRGSGGVVTPSPYENIVQAYYTSISADYNGIQFMLNCPWQLSVGIRTFSDHSDKLGILAKARFYGFSKTYYDLVVADTISRYRWPFELSGDYSLDSNNFRAFKFNLHLSTYTKSLGMAGVGVLVSNLNLLVASDLSMNRKLDVELTWIQVAGGYIMPLSPRVGGVNIAICGAVDLLGAKHLIYNKDLKKFYGAKIGSIGWLTGVGWNAFSLMNLSVYVGGEWSFSTGYLKSPSTKLVFADIGRNTLFCGIQATGRYFNLVGGIQKEWEYLDYQEEIDPAKSIRYYLGINYYFHGKKD
jgi:hypothetical protein